MAQSTRVVELSRTRLAELRSQLERGPYDFRALPHALFSARGEGVVATAYTSGKLVIQGDAPELFVSRYLAQAADSPGSVSPAAAKGSSNGEGDTAFVTMIGSDESGKGDYFGPLVVCAVRLESEQSRAMVGGPVRDSKQLDDQACLRLGAALRGSVPHAIAELSPPEYNAAHARYGNLNPLLADLHARAIRELARPGIRVLVDQFANEKVMRTALKGSDVELTQHPRAERVPAVAAASVIARERFLRGLGELSDRFGIDLAKGAGPPVDRAARAFVALHGQGSLGEVAKLHFKNTQKLPSRGP